MKKIILFVSTLAILVSCSKENNNLSGETSSPDRIIVRVNQTKTEMSYAEGTFSFGWKSGDAISLMEYVSEEMSSASGTSDPLSADTKTAAFAVKLDAQSLGSGQQFHYVAVYPVIDKLGLNGWSGSGADAYPILSVNIPSNQTIPSCTSFDPSADIMVSNVVNAASRPEDVSLCFARIGGILQLHLTGLPTDGSSIYVESGSISVTGTSYNFAGSFLYYPGDTMIESASSGSGTGTTSGDTTSGTGTSVNQISFTGNSACTVSSGATDVFLRCCAGTLSGNVSVDLTVNVDGEQHLFTKNFTIGGNTGSGNTGTGAGTGTGTGAGTGSGTGTSSGITIANGNITRMNIAVAEIPAYQVSLSDIVPGEEKCGVEAEVISVKGGSLTSLNAYICYALSPEATLEEFIAKSNKISLGKVPEDGKIFGEISGLSASTKYYLLVAVDDGKSVYNNGKVEEFETTAAKTPLSKVSNVNFDTTTNSFTASWDSVTGASGYNCTYWSEKNPDNIKSLSSKYSGGKWSATATGLTAGKYYFQVIPIPDSSHSESTENDSFDVTIAAPEPYIIFNAEYKDGKVRVWGTVDNYSSGTIYIHYDAVSDKGTADLTKHGSTSVSSGSFELELSDTFTEGQTYSFGGSVTISGKTYYSAAVAIKIESSTGGKDPTITMSAECKDGSVAIVGKVENFSPTGNYAYIHYVEGTESDPSKIQMKDGSPLGTDGSFSYIKSASDFSAGKSYSVCVSVNDGYNSYYSEVSVITIPEDSKDPTVTLEVGSFSSTESGICAVASGVVDSSLAGKMVYIYMANGTVTDVSNMTKTSGGSSDKSTGAYSINVYKLTNGATYSFCAAVQTGTGSDSGKTYYSEIKTITVSLGK